MSTQPRTTPQQKSRSRKGSGKTFRFKCWWDNYTYLNDLAGPDKSLAAALNGIIQEHKILHKGAVKVPPLVPRIH